MSRRRLFGDDCDCYECKRRWAIFLTTIGKGPARSMRAFGEAPRPTQHRPQAGIGKPLLKALQTTTTTKE